MHILIHCTNLSLQVRSGSCCRPRTLTAWPVWPWWTLSTSEAPGKVSSGRRTLEPSPSAKMTALKSRRSWCTNRETSIMVGMSCVYVCVCVCVCVCEPLNFSSRFLRLFKMLILPLKYSYLECYSQERQLFSALWARLIIFSSLAQTALVCLSD